MLWRQTLMLCTLLVITFVKLHQVACFGVFELRLKSFINEKGRDGTGQCCNGERYGPCTSSCRTRFRVCLTHYQTKIDTNSKCSFGDTETPVLGGNNVNFTQYEEPDLPGFNRTVRFPINVVWQNPFSVSLIVEAWHDSNATKDDVGMLPKTPFVFPDQNESGIHASRSQRLISQLAVHQELTVSPSWTPREYHANQTIISYEYRLSCGEHYYGDNCSKVCRPRNDSFGHYTCSSEGEILCLAGWKGDYCTKPLCSLGCNETHGYCLKPGECLCHSGYKGRLCDECESYPGCYHGTCQKPWDCLCDEGWGGLLCNQDLNFCTNHLPCKNGGTCFNTELGWYTCSCQPGYTGADCDQKINDCAASPCLNGAACKPNGTSYKCECSKGWYGYHCEIAMQTCETRPCKNGGTCMDSTHGYKCHCAAGFGGAVCDQRIRPCSPNPCRNDGACKISATNSSAYQCACKSGFTGPLCETNVNDCHGNPCQNGGTCLDLVNAYRCQCVPGYLGEYCEQQADMCRARPCANRGVCTNLLNDYKCQCRPGFRGKDCRETERECALNVCQNGGTCYERNDTTQCVCAYGYNGQRCEHEIDETGATARNDTANATSDLSRHVAMAGVAQPGENDVVERNWFAVALVVAFIAPAGIVFGAALAFCSKQKRDRERMKADDEARQQNEQNTIHNHVVNKVGGDGGGGCEPHRINNVWDHCASVKKLDAVEPIIVDPYYHHAVSMAKSPAVYAAIPADPDLLYTLQRSRSQKTLNVDAAASLQRHSMMCHRVSLKDLDNSNLR